MRFREILPQKSLFLSVEQTKRTLHIVALAPIKLIMDIFFLIPLLILPILVLLLLFFRANYKWNKSQKTLSSLNLNDYKKFENLRIGSNSHSGYRTIWGFTVDGIMYVNDNCIVLLPAKWSMTLAHTELPNWINSFDKIHPYQIGINTPNKISIKHKNQTLHLGECTIEFILKVENTNKKKEIIESMKNWF